jgi:septal ring factor EnvC (AmiA/AmiB activator)
MPSVDDGNEFLKKEIATAIDFITLLHNQLTSIQEKIDCIEKEAKQSKQREEHLLRMVEKNEERIASIERRLKEVTLADR